MRIAIVMNLCTHYRKPLFERLASKHECDFFFTSRGRERYWLREHRLEYGHLHTRRARPRIVLPFRIWSGRYDCLVASLTDRIALPLVAATAFTLDLPLVLWVGIWEHPRTPFHHLSRPVTRVLYRRAATLAVYGSHVARHIESETGRTDDVVVVPQAANDGAFRVPLGNDLLEALRRELRLEGTVAAYVGRLAEGKGVETLLSALAASRAVGTLLLVGSGAREPMLRRLAVSLGVADRVRFAGYVPHEQLPAYMQAVDMLVLPSVTTRRFKEPWGLVVNEAMAARVPVVATAAVGAAAGGLVIDGETGLVVPERDARALAQAMDRLAASPPLRERIAAKAFERLSGWTYEAAADAMCEAIALAVASRGRRHLTQ